MADPIDCFDVREHIINASHLRSYPRSARDENATFKLHVKQYVPLDSDATKAGAVTIIAAGGIGFPKVLHLISVQLTEPDLTKTAAGMLRALLRRCPSTM